jgi:hypothetical protein
MILFLSAVLLYALFIHILFFIYLRIPDIKTNVGLLNCIDIL